MRRVLIPILMSTLLLAVSACAFEAAEAEDLDEVSATEAEGELDTFAAEPDDRELDTPAALPEDQGPESLEGEQSPDGPTTNVTYYDGCRQEHQACRCQNTGWAGYCAWTDWFPELIMRCYCG